MNNLKNERLRLKQTQEEIARMLNISQNSYSRYETGEREPDLETLTKIAEYFDVTTDYLLGRTNVRNAETAVASPVVERLPPEIMFAFGREEYRELDDDDCKVLHDMAKRLLAHKRAKEQ